MGVKARCVGSRCAPAANATRCCLTWLVGCGPIMELIALAAYLPPTASSLLLCWWNTGRRFCAQDGQYSDSNRIDPRRLRFDDCSLLRDYCSERRHHLEWRMCGSRVNALNDNRERLLVQVTSELTPRAAPLDTAWAKLDRWGWLPGHGPRPGRRRDATPGSSTSAAAISNVSSTGLRFTPIRIDAFHEMVTLAYRTMRAWGSSTYQNQRSFRPGIHPKRRRSARARTFVVTESRAERTGDRRRNWMDACYLADGFHLSRTGAYVFTARLGLKSRRRFRK